MSANFVIPYPPGFPIMVPGQVITADTITFMRKLDVKEIHGYQAAHGLKVLKPSALEGATGAKPARHRPLTWPVVRTIQLDLLFTILAALVVLFTGRALTARSAFLKRFSIPAPVVGGVLVAILLALADGFGGVRISFDMSLRDNLLLMFFTTVGLSADARMLLKGGPKLMAFLVVSIVFIAVQNLVGLARRVRHGSPPGGRPARRLGDAHRRPRHRRGLRRPLRRHDEHRRGDGADDGVRHVGAGAREPARRTARAVSSSGATSCRRRPPPPRRTTPRRERPRRRSPCSRC